MNVPPQEFIPVAPERMRAFVTDAFVKAGLAPENAGLLARLLVTNDLRGVFSHGTRQVPAYVEHFRAGRLNPRPQVAVVSESPATALVDGDGSLGYFAAYRAAELAAEKAVAGGIAAAVSRNHGHIGAAGIYSRIPAELMPRMYPRLDEFRALRARADPDGRFASDLSRRLGL